MKLALSFRVSPGAPPVLGTGGGEVVDAVGLVTLSVSCPVNQSFGGADGLLGPNPLPRSGFLAPGRGGNAGSVGFAGPDLLDMFKLCRRCRPPAVLGSAIWKDVNPDPARIALLEFSASFIAVPVVCCDLAPEGRICDAAPP